MNASRSLVLLLLLATASIHEAYGQGFAARLLGRREADAVKLAWFVEGWPRDVDGFEVRRRDAGGGAWTPLHVGAIVPAIDPGRDLSGVEPDAAEARRLHRKLDSLVAAGAVTPAPAAAYVALLRTDAAAASALQGAFVHDYDLALLEGFGLVDRSALPGRAYAYGLFPVTAGTAADAPVATVVVEGAPPPPFAVDLKVRTAPLANPAQRLVAWTFDAGRYRALDLKGFHVYRRTGAGPFVRLTDRPLVVSVAPGRAEAEGGFVDPAFDAGTAVTYAVAPVDLFGVEGARATAGYDPAHTPANLVMPAIASAERDTSGAVVLAWTFPAAQEAAISGFVVERTDTAEPGGDAAISALLPPSARSFADTSATGVDVYYGYRVVVLQDGLPVGQSDPALVYAGAFRVPPVPAGLTGTWFRDEAGRAFIRLAWSAPPAGDTLTAGYYLFADRPGDPAVLREGSLGVLEGQGHLFEVFNTDPDTFHFQVAAVSGAGPDSPLSDTLAVYAPGLVMAPVDLGPFELDSNRVTLRWNYPALPDLAGFVLYQDGGVRLDAARLGAGAREVVLEVEPGQTYTFELVATSRYGVESPRSVPLRVRVRPL